jgi:hypothetical protein
MSSFRNYRNMSSYDFRGKQLCYVDSSEANRLVAKGAHELFCVSCLKVKGEGPCLTMGRSNHLIALREIAVKEDTDSKTKGRNESDCALTDKDMRQNVGITEGFPGDPADAAQVHRSRTRVKFWGWASAHNARAITVVSAT